MSNGSAADNGITCQNALAALAHGGAATDWEAVERHLAGCADCAAGLERLTAAIDEQFAASDVLAEPAAQREGRAPLAAPESAGRVLRLPARGARRRPWRRVALFGGAVAAA